MNTTQLRRGAAALAAGAVIFAVGCGGSDDSATASDDPADAVRALYAAAGEGDAAAMCDVMSEAAQENAKTVQGADSCEDAISQTLQGGGGELFDSIEVGEADVEGDSGTVEISAFGNKDKVRVVKEDGEWKVEEDS
jgi:ketosteroid isomerase-like protein